MTKVIACWLSSLVFFFWNLLVLASPDIIFVGAGPIGLHTAIQAKLLKPSLEIVLLERYPEYKRRHTIYSDGAKSFKNSVSLSSYPYAESMKKNYSGAVRTAILEKDLNAQALLLGIQIRYGNVVSVNEVHEKFPETRFIIGSDGSHSLVRKDQFSDQALNRRELQYLTEVKYEVEKPTRKLSSFEYFKNLRKVNHLITAERVGKETLVLPKIEQESREERKEAEIKDEGSPGVAPVAFAVVTSEGEYKATNPYTNFKNPIVLDSSFQDPSHHLPASLQETISTWLSTRRTETGEEIVPGSIKVTTLPLVEYFTVEPHRLFNGIHYFLVGDAAFGVPYYRSINNGFESGNVLARVLAKMNGAHLPEVNVCDPRYTNTPLGQSLSYLTGMLKLKQETPEDYVRFIQALQSRESIIVKAKDLGLEASKLAASRSQGFYQLRRKVTDMIGKFAVGSSSSSVRSFLRSN